jgi:hypothetical protein
MQLLFVPETQCVHCTVRTLGLKVSQINFRLQVARLGSKGRHARVFPSPPKGSFYTSVENAAFVTPPTASFYRTCITHVLQTLYNTMEQTTRAFLLPRLEALATRWAFSTR